MKTVDCNLTTARLLLPVNKLEKVTTYPGQSSPFSLIPLPIAPKVPPHVDVQQRRNAIPRLQQVVDQIAGQCDGGLRGGLQGQWASLRWRGGPRVPGIDAAESATLRPPTPVAVAREPAVVIAEAILAAVLVAPTPRQTIAVGHFSCNRNNCKYAMYTRDTITALTHNPG